MNAGLPVIAFNFGSSIYEVIDDNKTGFIIENDNEELYKEKLLEYMNNLSLREEMSHNAKNKAKDFDIKNIVPKWYDLFNNKNI